MRLVDDGDGVDVVRRVAGQSQAPTGEAAAHHQPLALRCVRRHHPEPVLGLGTQAQHEVAGEGVHPLEALARVLVPHRSPGGVVLVGGRDGGRGEAELDGVVVGDQEQGTGGEVLGAVEDPGPSSADGGGRRLRGTRVDRPLLAGVAALAAQQHDLAAPGRADRQREPLIGLLEDEDVVVGRGADPVPPDLVGAVRRVVDGVEEVRRVRAPRPAVVAARHHLVEVGPGAQVAEPELVDLLAGAVRRPGQEVLVRTDQGHAEVEVVGPAGDRVDVEHHLGVAVDFVVSWGLGRRIRCRFGLITADFPNNIGIVIPECGPRVVGKPATAPWW